MESGMNNKKNGRCKALYARNKSPKKNKCLIVENGKPCTSIIRSRGLCNKHEHSLRKYGNFEKYALPKKNVYHKETSYKKNKTPKKGICVVLENEKPCTLVIRTRGLCNRHEQSLRRHGDLEKYALPEKYVYRKETSYKINKRPKKGMCIVLENEKPCTSKIRSRGLCNKHAHSLRRSGEYEKHALPYRAKR